MQLTIEDYAKYPFLDSIKLQLPKLPILQLPLYKLIETEFGKKTIELTKHRLKCALYKTAPELSFNPLPEHEIASFFFARIVITLPKYGTSAAIEKFVEYESEKFLKSYKADSRKMELNKELGFGLNTTKISVIEYIPLCVHLIKKTAEWKLVNRELNKGYVILSPNDLEQIFKERLKKLIRDKLNAIKLDETSKKLLDPISDEIFASHYEKLTQNYGEYSESAIPPCIQNTIDMIQRHENPTHPARFAMVAFLHEIGLPDEQIIGMFGTVRDFHDEHTRYQVGTISGKYTPPACDSLKTNGICRAGNNLLCKKVKHPLNYYKIKKRQDAKFK